jgi:hypothetical protein
MVAVPTAGPAVGGSTPWSPARSTYRASARRIRDGPIRATERLSKRGWWDATRALLCGSRLLEAADIPSPWGILISFGGPTDNLVAQQIEVIAPRSARRLGESFIDHEQSCFKSVLGFKLVGLAPELGDPRPMPCWIGECHQTPRSQWSTLVSGCCG